MVPLFLLFGCHLSGPRFESSLHVSTGDTSLSLAPLLFLLVRASAGFWSGGSGLWERCSASPPSLGHRAGIIPVATRATTGVVPGTSPDKGSPYLFSSFFLAIATYLNTVSYYLSSSPRFFPTSFLRGAKFLFSPNFNRIAVLLPVFIIGVLFSY